MEDELTMALTTLESTRYFQGRKSVNEYIDDFQELVDLAGCMDNVSIVMKFRRGLDPTIEKHLVVSENPIPIDGLQAWYDRSRRYDASQRTHAAFVTGTSRPPPQHGFPRGTFPKPPLPPFGTTTNLSTQTLPPTQRSDGTRPRPPAPLPDGRHAPKPDDTCDLCGRPGHTSRTCYVRQRVHALNANDHQDWVERLMAVLDMADPSEDSASSDASTVVDDDAPSPVSDFVPRSA
jgi:hypothetical protein